MQSYVIFTCALTLLLTSLHVLAQENNCDPDIEDSAIATVINLVQLQMSTSRDKHQLRDVTQDLATLHKKNLLLESRNKNLHGQLSAVTSQQNTLVAQLSAVTSQLQEAQNDCNSQQKSMTSQLQEAQNNCKAQHKLMTEQLDRQAVEMRSMRSQLEADIRKEIMKESLESGKLIEKLTRENEMLKLKSQECQSYKDAVLKELRTEVGDLSHNMSLQVQSDHRQMSADIRAELGAVKSLINMSLQSDNMVSENVVKILSGQRQLSSNITTKVWEQCMENSKRNEDISRDNITALTNTVATLKLENENLKKSDENLKAVVSKHVQEKSVMTSQMSELQDNLSICAKDTKLWEQWKESSQKVEENLKAKISDLTNIGTTLRLENENCKKSDEKLKAIVSKHVQEKSVMTSQLSELQSKLAGVDMLRDVKTSQSEHTDMLTQVLTKLEQHDVQLKPDRNHSRQLHIDLPTTKLNKKRYYYSSDQPWMTRHEADNFCRSHNMQLASVETRAEWQLLKPEVTKLAVKITWPWSSGSDAAEEGKWKWTATGSDVIFFAGRDMNNVASENCMFLTTDWWYDDPCTFTRPFICEVNSPC